MYKKSSKFIFSLFLVGFVVFCFYVVYQFVLYENYSSGRWEKGECGFNVVGDCKFGEKCTYGSCPEGADCMPTSFEGECEPQMKDLMETIFGEGED